MNIFQNGSSGAAFTIADGNPMQALTLSAACTITVAYPLAGIFTLELVTGATPYAVTWTGLSFASGDAAALATLLTNANKKTVLQIFNDGAMNMCTGFKQF